MRTTPNNLKLRPGKILITGILAAAASLFVAAIQGPSSSGAPASHTGAPGEQTCAMSGCHDDNQLNAGPAALTIDMGGVTEYKPNRTYTIRVRISDPSLKRFGFQITALSNSQTKAGKFKITDAVRTQMVSNMYELLDREYVTYTFEGTDAVSTGTGEWVLNWKAPAVALGPVTLYVGAVAANDNENDKGDFVYTGSLVLNPKK